jgi:hypothetical protein
MRVYGHSALSSPCFVRNRVLYQITAFLPAVWPLSSSSSCGSISRCALLPGKHRRVLYADSPNR